MNKDILPEILENIAELADELRTETVKNELEHGQLVEYTGALSIIKAACTGYDLNEYIWITTSIKGTCKRLHQQALRLLKKSGVQGDHPPAGRGDGGKCVPCGHNGEAVSDPQSSTEARAGHGSAQNADRGCGSEPTNPAPQRFPASTASTVGARCATFSGSMGLSTV